MTICDRSVPFKKRDEEEPSRSAEVMASNDDLLTELLLLLPVKSLLKFKSVCKHWLSLISDPHFACRKHRKSNAVSAFYLDCRSRLEGVEYYKVAPLDFDHWESVIALEHLDFAGYPRRIEIEQSCNGLFLIHSFEEKKYMVYNPTTKQSKTLPPVPAGDETLVWGFSLAFDPSISDFYKVVCILNTNRGCQILIYSSEIGLWRVCGAPFTSPFRLGIWTGVYCNGAIHWVMERDFPLCFDLNGELVQEIPLPPPLDNFQWLRRYVGESGGRLYFVVSDADSTTYLDVYQMEIDRSGWFLKFRVDSDALARFTMPSEHIYIRSILYVARGETEEDSFMVLYLSSSKVILYNLLNQTSRDICELDFRTFVRAAYEYIETLSLV